MVPPDSHRISGVPCYLGTRPHSHTLTPTGLSPAPAPLPTDFGFTHGFLLRTHMTVWIKSSPTTPAMQRLSAITHHGFSLIRFRSPLLSESLLFSLPAGTEMFQFARFASTHLCIQCEMTLASRVSPSDYRDWKQIGRAHV